MVVTLDGSRETNVSGSAVQPLNQFTVVKSGFSGQITLAREVQ